MGSQGQSIFSGGFTGLGVRDQFLACLLSWVLVSSAWGSALPCLVGGPCVNCEVTLVRLQNIPLKEFILFAFFESLLVSEHSIFSSSLLKSFLFDNLLAVYFFPLDTSPISNLKKGETSPEKQIVILVEFDKCFNSTHNYF